MSQACRVCFHQTSNQNFTVSEMMFGWPDYFAYFECSACGCVQIAEIPENLERYYPSDYYAYGRPEATVVPAISSWRRLRNQAFLGQHVPLGGLIRRFIRSPGYFYWFKGINLNLDSRILDLGCGSGSLLLRMRKAGFTQLEGVDPFISEDIDYGSGLTIRKTDITAIKKQYDLIMSHHSFEHMPDPVAALSTMAELLTANGALLLRIPVAGGYAWRKYRNCWINLDPPRHLHLHTPRSIGILAKRCGLRIERIFYDSTAQQIVGSELFQLGIPLQESSRVSDLYFDADYVRHINEFVRDLNKHHDGDCAGFILRREI